MSDNYTIEQSISDMAQLTTIAFSGLAFITGNFGADTFFPPGKVADFFGFQYMRDVDVAGYGHNTTFLTRIANNIIYILNDEQKAKLIALAKEQAPIYANFATTRFQLIDGFRRNLEGRIPSKSTGIDSSKVAKFTLGMYEIDATLSYNRAVVVGSIINSLTDAQKAYLAPLQFNNYLTWPDLPVDETFKKNFKGMEYTCAMTYASELFSWYKGSINADVYFCPERHGTYFGGFFLKDYPAMNNPDYFIGTDITRDSGMAFLNTLDTTQQSLIRGIISEQKTWLFEIVQVRTTIATELRRAMTGKNINRNLVFSLIKRYGELDGLMSALYDTRFTQVNKTLTEAQRSNLIAIRNLDVVPQGVYQYSTLIDSPIITNTDFLF